MTTEKEVAPNSATTASKMYDDKRPIISKVVNNLTAKIMKSKLWGKTEDESPAKK